MAGREINSVLDIARQRMCLGCGACAYICPEDKIQLMDYYWEGIRPSLEQEESSCSGCNACVDVCPGLETSFQLPESDVPQLDDLPVELWGRVLEMWEGHATDEEIRFQGSSGGALTALAAYCLEEAAMDGVLHVGQDPEDALRNRTRLSRNREELLAAAGSRYSPASVCNGLDLMERAEAPCAIIGKPSEIAAVRKAESLNPALAEKVGVTLSFFCAETPPTQATEALLTKMGVSAEELEELRFRGRGWPGHFAPRKKGEMEPAGRMTYQESWAFLQSYRPWSVHLWPDGTGELADISCGDPWYEAPDGSNPGFSLIVVRTERGREILRGAMEKGYLTLQPAEGWKLEKSQANLADKKGAVWGRLLAMRLVGLRTPNFLNAGLLKCWGRLSSADKVKSTLGTLRRIFSKGIRKPFDLETEACKPVGAPLDALAPEPTPEEATRS